MRQYENARLEFKREYTETIRKSVIAFANSDGGTILVGVDDDGSVRGLGDVDRTRVRIGDLIRDSIRPDVRLFVSASEESRDGRTILRIDVQRGTARPYYWKAKGLRPEGVFVRQDAASVPASETAIRELLRQSAGDSFERARSLRQDLTFRAAAAFFRERGVGFGPAQRRSLGFVGEDGLYTNLALLLSDQCPATLKLAVFEGTGKTVFRERREIGGSVLAQVREAFDYVDRWNRTRAEVRGLDRVERRDYPPEGVREALLNAVVHRDYALPGADLVSLFDDRLEVLSAGGLVPGVSLSDVLLGLSALRNPALAGVFYRLRLIEAYGTGLLKIREEYAEEPRPPAVEASDHAFKVTLWNRNAAPSVLPSTRPAVPRAADPDDRAARVLAVLREKGGIGRADVEALCGVSSATAARLLARLAADGRIAAFGRGPATRYRLSARPWHPNTKRQ
ncbi:MAG: putative DNA binding domain-containing protein [Kiritimatiellae bacterium]|nr:putative DNA binding domain-containing protein [Kiritimatiellia bacterium]